LINENKWRAGRYGIDGKLIDFGKEVEVDTRILIEEMLLFVDDIVDELGSRDEINSVRDILKNGTGSDRQLAVYDKTNDLKKVVGYIIDQTALDVM
jgi:carboxylate-amine ligase